MQCIYLKQTWNFQLAMESIGPRCRACSKLVQSAWGLLASAKRGREVRSKMLLAAIINRRLLKGQNCGCQGKMTSFGVLWVLYFQDKPMTGKAGVFQGCLFKYLCFTLDKNLQYQTVKYNWGLLSNLVFTAWCSLELGLKKRCRKWGFKFYYLWRLYYNLGFLAV